MEIKIDDPQTGIGDGFALDFVQILINPHEEYTCTGNIKGIVKDEEGNLLDSVLVTNGSLKETLTNIKGKFALMNVPSGLANVTAQKSGKKGTINLYGIHFATNKTIPKPDSKATLDALLSVLKSDKKLKIIIVGHTDSDGTEEFNQKLSEKRAESVRSWLTKHGISGSRMKYKGMGESSPVASNKTKEGKALNRRVEIILQ